MHRVQDGLQSADLTRTGRRLVGDRWQRGPCRPPARMSGGLQLTDSGRSVVPLGYWALSVKLAVVAVLAATVTVWV
jgi:hypothetical protein